MVRAVAARAARGRGERSAVLRGVVGAVVLLGLAGTAYAGAGRTIEETESLRVAAFWLVFIILSLMVEKMFHYSEHSLEHAGKKGILAAVSKIKEELMLMGFISLMLLACEDQITYFCIPNSVAQWITCDKDDPTTTCGADDVTSVLGTPCCTLGDYYWSHLYESTIKMESRRRMQNASTEELMLEQAVDMMGEAYSHRRLGAVNRHNSLLRTTCPSRKYTQDVDSFGEAVMPPAVHPFDCPANGLKTNVYEDGEHGDSLDPNLGHRSGHQGGNKNEIGGFTSNSFMDPQALHHVHTLIFLTACFHVFFTVMVMIMAQWRIKQWYDWEFYGDAEDGSETVDKLRSPLPINNPLLALVANWLHQFVKTVDPYTYIAIRRYYVVRNNLAWDFEFNKVLLDTQDADFAELVGIEPWMWCILMGQCILDGWTTSVVLKTVGTWISLFLTMMVGTKLVAVFRHVVYGVADHYDTERDGIIDQNDLDRLQGKDGEVDPTELDGVIPNFWFDEPKHMLQILRFTMFQFSVTLAEVVFYLWQVSSHACYFQARGSVIYVVLLVVCGACILLGVVTVPLYSLATTTTHHDHDIKNPDRKPIKKKLKTHKAVLNADLNRLKVALGLDEEPEQHEKRADGGRSWKEDLRQKQDKEAKAKANRDPVKQAEIDAKKQMRGTFEWAIHMSQLEARIKLAREELQAVQRVKSQTKEERKIAIEAARNAATAKLKANKVAPSPDSPRSPEDAGEIAPLKHTGDLPPLPGTPQAESDVEHGDNHHEHGDADAHGHGDEHGHGEHGDEHDHGHGHGHGHHAEKCCGKEFPMPAFAMSHLVGVLIAFTLFSTIPAWHHYAAESPGAHWKYEGANGPEWWGSIKERWAICSAGENGTTWSMQSPIDLNLNIWNGVGDGSSVWTGVCSDLSYSTHDACTQAGGVWTSTGFNGIVHSPGILEFELDPNNAAGTQGYKFNPTQSHGSPRYDCGTMGKDAKDGACGKVYWLAPGRCLETSVDATKHDPNGRVSNPDQAAQCFQAENEPDCVAHDFCTWHAGAASDEVYNVRSFSFHTPSEHLVNGNKYAMEMQIVLCTGQCTLDADNSYFAGDSAEDPDKFAVYSVLFEAGNPAAPAALEVAKMFEYIKRDCPQNRDKFGYELAVDDGFPGDEAVPLEEQAVCAQTTDDLKLSNIINLNGAWRTDSRRAAQGFYAYTGSLTEPPCTENIQWFLQEQVVEVGADTIQMLWRHIHAHPGNSRPVQNRNGRKLTFYQETGDDVPGSVGSPNIVTGR